MKPRRFPLPALVWALACLPACTVPRTALPPPFEPRSLATDPAAQATDPRPFPALEAGMHTAMITRLAADAAGRYAVTASDDKTARVWELTSGKLLQVLRVPVGENHEGKLFAVALSPDGQWVALGGFTAAQGDSENIYLFDRASGRMVGRIGGLSSSINHLAFSPDGRRLAAALGGPNGIRLYAAEAPWRELGRDVDYGDDSFSVDFDRRGRLVATSYDGKLRLYDADLRLLVAPRTVAGGKQPFFARFSPDGLRIAVGFRDSTAVSVISGEDLGLLYPVDTRAADNGSLNSVAWSADGETLYAAGRNRLDDGQFPVRAWPQQGRGTMQSWPVATDTVMDLRPLSDGRLVFAAADPSWGVLDARGHRLVQQTPPILDLRGNFEAFRLSAAGDVVEFQQKTWHNGRWQLRLARFDLATRRLEREVAPLAGLHAPSTRGLAMADWFDTTHPRLAGQPLALEPHEYSRSLAVSPDARRFALGANWHVYLFDHQGHKLWRKPTPGTAWLVNLSADGRYVVAALGDGSLRWYRTDDAGSEALAFFVHADGERWVLWTPEGFYDASPGADDLIGYHLNQGRDQAGELVASGRLSKTFYRPDLIARRLAGDEAAITAAVREVGDVRQVLTAGLRPELRLLSAATAESEGEYELKLDIKARGGGVGEVEIRINGKKLEGRTSPPTGGMMSQRLSLAPGRNVIAAAVNDRANKQVSEPVQAVVIVRPPIGKPTLHVLAIGVSNYEDAGFATEGIRYAAQDARDFAAKLQQRGQGMYETIDAVVLTKPEEVKLTRIEEALRALAQRYRPQDVAVIYLAGHGRAVDGKYHFIPGDLIFENEDSLRGHALTQAKLEEHLKALGAGKQLLVIDTCHAGAMTQTRAGPDERFAIANLMKMTGSAILAATLPDQLAVQDNFKGHGVFTGSLLEGLDGPADFNHSGFVDVDELASYAVKVVPDRAASIKDGVPQGAKQRPMRQTTGEPFDIARIPEIP